MKQFLHGVINVLLWWGTGAFLAYATDIPVLSAMLIIGITELYLDSKRIVKTLFED